jgi:hypothetical protein
MSPAGARQKRGAELFELDQIDVGDRPESEAALAPANQGLTVWRLEVATSVTWLAK